MHTKKLQWSIPFRHAKHTLGFQPKKKQLSPFSGKNKLAHDNQRVSNYKILQKSQIRKFRFSGTYGGGPHESRILAGYYGFNANISFTFQAVRNLYAHPT